MTEILTPTQVRAALAKLDLSPKRRRQAKELASLLEPDGRASLTSIVAEYLEDVEVPSAVRNINRRIWPCRCGSPARSVPDGRQPTGHRAHRPRPVPTRCPPTRRSSTGGRPNLDVLTAISHL